MFSSVLCLGAKGVVIDRLLDSQVSYRYQTTKINSMSDEELSAIKTVFIGDSSLASAIDTAYFIDLSGSNSLSLPLTARYGYAGSYNMLKQITRRAENLENVVVMHTFDLGQRDANYDSYLFTFETANDLLELSPVEKLHTAKTFVQTCLVPSHLIQSIRFYLNPSLVKGFEDFSQYDYVPQRKPIDTKNEKNLVRFEDVNPQKTRFLSKLVDFSQEKQLNLVYVHGPVWDDLAENNHDYINEFSDLLLANDVNLIADLVTMPDADVGDAYDHVKPTLRRTYTERYFDLLKDSLN
jgi:hypothetical protein